MVDPQIIAPRNPHQPERKEYAILILGVIALIAGLVLLAQFAVGIILLLLGVTAVNRYLKNHHRK